MSSLLPPHDGLLPYYLLWACISAEVHTFVLYFGNTATALTVFSGPNSPPPQPLLARVYGVKNTYTSLIRAYAAYHITNPEVYHLALLTFVGVGVFYLTETFIYRTVTLKHATWPFVTAAVGITWMVMQKAWYLSQS